MAAWSPNHWTGSTTDLFLQHVFDWTLAACILRCILKYLWVKQLLALIYHLPSEAFLLLFLVLSLFSLNHTIPFTVTPLHVPWSMPLVPPPPPLPLLPPPSPFCCSPAPRQVSTPDTETRAGLLPAEVSIVDLP